MSSARRSFRARVATQDQARLVAFLRYATCLKCSQTLLATHKNCIERNVPARSVFLSRHFSGRRVQSPASFQPRFCSLNYCELLNKDGFSAKNFLILENEDDFMRPESNSKDPIRLKQIHIHRYRQKAPKSDTASECDMNFFF